MDIEDIKETKTWNERAIFGGKKVCYCFFQKRKFIVFINHQNIRVKQVKNPRKHFKYFAELCIFH